jgi:hypothetical protein
MPEAPPSTPYATGRYTHERGAVAPALVQHLVTYAGVLMDAGALEADPQVPGAWKGYGTAGFDSLLKGLTPLASRLTGHELLPTYSYVRLYMRGHELVPHRDRAECEHSATLHLGSAGGGRWPIHLKEGDAPSVSVDLAPGDLLLYRGDTLVHWRDPLEEDWYLQVFLHWVDAAGPHADTVFDRRPSLGRSADEKALP